MTPCPHPGCPGTVTPSGYCRVSGERVDPVAGLHSSAAVPGRSAALGPSAARATSSSTVPEPDGPEQSEQWYVVPGRTADVELPDESPDPTLLPEIRPRDGAAPPGKPGKHGTPGTPRTPGTPGDPEAQSPPDAQGPRDTQGPRDAPGTGDPLSGQLLADQYRMVRLLGHGGMGEVYLALDTKVDDREVAVKFLRPVQAAVPRGALEKERQAFADLNHEGIIPVFNYGHHEGVGDFLVLPYVDGLNLEEVRALASREPERFGGARFHEFVLAYGVRVLSALEHLHAPERRKVYGDLKPQNVMHDGTTTKLIDVGSIRGEGAPGLTTTGYRAPTVPTATGASTSQDDLFSLGETLRSVCGLGESRLDLAALGALDRLASSGPDEVTARAALRMTTPAPQGLGLVSLARVLARATREERADRFATAREMEEQLRGVFRELRSLRTGLETFEPSPLFLQSPYALEGALGVAPRLSRWAAPPEDDGPRAPLHAPPSAADVAQRLPVPRPDPDDAHHAELSRLSDADPAALLQHTKGWAGSAEVHLLRCRLELRVALRAPDSPATEAQFTEPDLADAERELRLAVEAIGARRARHDWRVDWHHGLLALARDQVEDARDLFDRVYAAIPGEYAPKLALGYCAERLGRRHEALTFHEAVRLRNPSLGGAAFGVARAWLAQGGPKAEQHAVEALDAVPQHSRHRTAARTAAVRIGVSRAEDAGQLGAVLRRLARLFHEHGLTDEQARVRMKAEVWEAAQDLLARDAIDARQLGALSVAPDAARIGFPGDERQLRKDLSRFYLGLAQQAARSAAPDGAQLAERLLDRAYQVRPYAYRHHRDSPWLGKRISNWLRAAARTPPKVRPPRSDSR
ncbi:tetratricopeptide repeat protein [Streptomyces jeddahensis]|uniref:Serine/threonine-protein kinase PknG n=1 Tax=Streptomyces jeddahensis TaxID=1716141 RepID=A0A177HWC6_9ACTN|nr:tetratricopeptide repeat protein [Streptomyces jeddahensis]OAH15203.1 serine/threonine-protein kinase PknG [Streptomyces jeddahensis]